MDRSIRIVVGEGRTAQRGLLRFVLEGEGLEVVAEARTAQDLAGVIGDQRPDVVVLDDGIGVMAVSMVRDVAPQTKIVLVWPSAVVPIGGDVRVEPAQILRDLGPAVKQLAAAGAGAPLTESFRRPEWIDRVRKDPATLRDKLEGTETARRPSVTQLQRRGRRLHPSGRRRKAGAQPAEEGVAAPVVVLPVGSGTEAGEPILDIGGGTSAGGAAPVEERSEWNRRLGTLALSGAAAVSALVLALALGGGRIPVSVVRGGGFLPPGVPGFSSGSTVGPFDAGTLGGDGYTPFVPGVEVEPPIEAPGDQDDGLGGDPALPGPGDGIADPGPGEEPGEEPGEDPGEDPGEGPGEGPGKGPGKTPGEGTDVDGPRETATVGHSAEHNPFGGPPSKLGLTPAKGTGLGTTLDKAGGNHSSQKHGNSSSRKHAHKH